MRVQHIETGETGTVYGLSEYGQASVRWDSQGNDGPNYSVPFSYLVEI